MALILSILKVFVTLIVYWYIVSVCIKESNKQSRVRYNTLLHDIASVTILSNTYEFSNGQI